MALNIDVDVIWHLMGQWQISRPVSYEQKMKLALLLAKVHLKDGYDVLIVDHIAHERYYEQFELVANEANALLVEFALRNEIDEAIKRFIKRGKAAGYADGFRPGGIMIAEGREEKIRSMHAEVERIILCRPNTKIIDIEEGNIEQAYLRILEEILYAKQGVSNRAGITRSRDRTKRA